MRWVFAGRGMGSTTIPSIYPNARSFPRVVLLLVLTACSGEIADRSTTAGGPAPDSVQGPDWVPGGPVPAARQAGPLPLRMLTRVEYQATVRDLFGVDAASVVSTFPEEIDGTSGFTTVGLPSEVHVRSYMEAVERLARDVVGRVPSVTDCDFATDEMGCARGLAEKLGLRVYRRPLTAAEVDDHVAVYREARDVQAKTPQEAARVVISLMLQSPLFLYRWEVGEEQPVVDGIRALGPYQLASRLSYFLWGSMPDQALFDAAASGAMATANDVEQQARRMLDDPRARPRISSFFEQLLSLSNVLTKPKSDSRYPGFGDEVRDAMLDEARLFVADGVFGDQASLDTLLTGNYGFVNDRLQGIYGLEGLSSEFARVDLPPEERAGLLTLPAFLTATGDSSEGNPVVRGVVIRERVLCEELPPPPDDIPEPPETESNADIRTRLEAHTRPPACHACHQHINPLGFALGRYDAIGAYVRDGSEADTDISGVYRLISDPSVAIPFNGARALAELLASRPEVHACLTRQLARFAYGRHESPADSFSLEHAYRSLLDSDLSVRELLVGIATSISFRESWVGDGDAGGR